MTRIENVFLNKQKSWCEIFRYSLSQGRKPKSNAETSGRERAAVGRMKDRNSSNLTG